MTESIGIANNMLGKFGTVSADGRGDFSLREGRRIQGQSYYRMEEWRKI